MHPESQFWVLRIWGSLYCACHNEFMGLNHDNCLPGVNTCHVFCYLNISMEIKLLWPSLTHQDVIFRNFFMPLTLLYTPGQPHQGVRIELPKHQAIDIHLTLVVLSFKCHSQGHNRTCRYDQNQLMPQSLRLNWTFFGRNIPENMPVRSNRSYVAGNRELNLTEELAQCTFPTFTM